MERLLEFRAGDAAVFLLAFLRLAGVLIVAPPFGGGMTPKTVRIFLALLLAFLVFPSLGRPDAGAPDGMMFYALAGLSELGMGLLLGLAASLLFAAARLGGQLIDQEMGLMLSGVIDPVSNERFTPIGQFKFLLAMVIYLLIDGHHWLVRTAAESFSSVPLAGGRFTEGAAMHVSDALVGDLFRMALQLAAPAMVALFLVTIALAFMARAVPEMNIFVTGFALRVGVGLLVVAAGVGIFAAAFGAMCGDHAGGLRRLVELMGR